MARRNILWIMCDQLRFDYLSCSGHKAIKTPNIDRLAERGVRFNKTYVQSPICGPSRMSFYTGRYVRSHGSNWNGYPLRVGEPTLGTHLDRIGVRSVLVGKTHMAADREGMERLGIDPQSIIGIRESQCGFETYERDDGLVPNADPEKPTEYNAYLKEKGYDGDNPWHEWANAGEDTDGKLLSGWLLSHADKPARIEEEDSESPYMTRRAMEFIRKAESGKQPWCLHLSYIKPHWPYIVPAPYHDLYDEDDVQPAIRDERERVDPHPLYAEYMKERVSKAFSKEEVRRRVIPAYMGLIKQIDDQIGLLLDFLEENGRDKDTMIVFTSDHGDYLGDHWMGEKELFHDVSVRIPLIIFDPDSRADATRGQVVDELVESIDLAPTFLDYFGGTSRPHILEGRSLMPWIEGTAKDRLRQYAISEYEYAMRGPRLRLNMPVRDCRLVMVADERWKYVYVHNLPPMLYDTRNDPQEFHDLGRDPDYADVRARLHEAMTQWSLRMHNRITISDEQIESTAGKQLANNILIGYWDEEEVETARLKQFGRKEP